MFKRARAHLVQVFDFLDILDCYIGEQKWMEKEIEDFDKNKDRHIAALVCQNIDEKLVYKSPYIRILYVLSGGLELQIDNKLFNYTAGCLIMANEWTKISYLLTEPETEIVSFIFKKEYFSDNLLNQLIEDSLMYRFFVENVKTDIKKSNFFVFQFEPNQDIHFYALLLLKQVVKMKYKYNRITKSAFILLVTEIGDLVEEHLRLKDSSLSSSILIYEIIADIEANYKDITLTHLAKKYYYHPNYLSNLIMEKTGKKFSELVLNFRLKQACNYLEQTNMSVQNIITQIGYSDKTYFYKIFKKEYGMTPKEYRYKLKKENQNQNIVKHRDNNKLH